VFHHHYRKRDYEVALAMDDHPFNDLPLGITNFYTRKFNFLCTASKSFNVVTALVVRDLTDPSKPKLTFLGRMVWGAELGCSLRWSKGTDGILTANPAEYATRRFYCDDPNIDPDLTPVIESLSDSTETFNDAAKAAFQTVMGSNSVNRNVRAFEKWSSDKVEKFFK
jgi:hypothetical protein